MPRLLIRNGDVVSLDDQIGTVADCDVLMVDGEIVAVVRVLSGVDAKVIGTSRLPSRALRPSLSIDTTASVPGDMFMQMRSALPNGLQQLPKEDRCVV
jgi:hypothetical protein